MTTPDNKPKNHNAVLYESVTLTKGQLNARTSLSNLVYPPNTNWEGWSIEWTPNQWCIICWDPKGNAICHAGAVFRQGISNGEPALIGGIGGVMTHPEHRKKGLATQAIELLLDLFKEKDVDFSLLVCEPELIPYYNSLGFAPFQGELLVTQRGKPCPFTFNLPMVKPICSNQETTGVIDLLGPPW